MVARYYQELLNFCWRSLRNREQAADLVQESYARVLGAQDRHALREEGERAPRALLYHTARNLIIDNHRRASVRQHEELETLPDAEHPAAPLHLQPEQALAGSQNWQACVAAIDALPPRCREALVLHLFEELPQAQIAARMPTTPPRKIRWRWRPPPGSAGAASSMRRNKPPSTRGWCRMPVTRAVCPRRHWLRALPYAAAAMLVLGVGAGGYHWWQQQATFNENYASQRGQRLAIDLPDGSRLQLDTATRIQVALYRQRREVRLLQGAALFTVQARQGQPFDVVSGPLRVTVVGTQFSVRNTVAHDGQLGVAVQHLHVRVAGAQQATLTLRGQL